MWKRFCHCAFLLFSLFLAVSVSLSCFWRFSTATSLPVLAERSDRTVILDAGHGGIDAGAIGVNGMLEKDLNLSLTLLLAERFRQAGVKVVLTRTEDALVLREGDERSPGRKVRDLEGRLAVAKQYPDSLFVSIHMNSFPTAECKGLEVHYANDEVSEAVARSVMGRVKETLMPDSRRTPKKAGDDIYLLKNAVTPAVLIECGFLSNGEEAAKLSDKDYQKELSFCLFCAIMDVEF
ncbi:MAG: N-acetylmuramoyl-L-alanine amidase [Clostridia bacterium]|nr:N-acetylmuramoyl-L-alanine amidase [Clostridia bacterium]